MLKTLAKILSYSWTSRIPYNRALLIIAGIFEVISKASGLALPFLLKHLIDCFVDPQLLNSNTTVYFVIGYGLLWLLNPLAKTIQITCKNVVMEKSVNLLIFDLFKHIINLPMQFHLDKKTGAVMNTLTQLRQFLMIFWDGFIWLVAPLIFEVTAAIGLISFIYGPIYGVSLFAILVIYSVINVITAKYTMKTQISLQEKLSSLSSYMSDILLNFETVKSFANENFELVRCDEYLERQRESARHSGRIMESLGLIQNCVIGVGLTLIMFYAFTQIRGNVLVFSDFVLLNTYVLQFSLPMSYLTYAFRDSKQAYAVLKEGLKILDEKNTIHDHGSIDLSTADSYKIEFDNVSFAYKSAQTILEKISFTANAGKKLAIVGSTGSGKSTISRLLLRYFDVSSGMIRINNMNITDYKLDSLRKSIGVIPQDTILFNDTLYANVHYGNPSASNQEVLDAIKSACLDRFVSNLSEGVNTIVGERGVKLSGGERQRIAIARAILKKPKIFIFDEATSSLDSKTEQEIQANLERISAGVTTLIIAHRLSTIQNANTIIVLENGYVVEQGSHETLLTKKGAYFRFWNTQMENSLDLESSVL